MCKVSPLWRNYTTLKGKGVASPGIVAYKGMWESNIGPGEIYSFLRGDYEQ